MINDLYKLLFGRKGMAEGSVIDMAEHGRAGGLSTGQGYKNTRNVDELTYIDQASNSITYLGYAPFGSATSDSVWQIRRIMASGNTTIIAYADGDDNYNNVWDDRGSLTYN